VSLAELLASKRLERHSTSAKEIAGLRKLVSRDLQDAAVPGLSADRAFATAYNAALQLSKIVLACAGYRVSASLPGHHQVAFEAAGFVLGAPGNRLTVFFETCRRKRNVIDYDFAEVASPSQARELQEKVREYRELIEGWIAKHYGEYAR
jgi:hypothetical protein